MVFQPHLKTGIWIDALIRRAQVAGAFASVVQKGDADAGSVLVAVRGRDALTLYTPERDMEGRRIWRAELTDDAAMAETLKARLKFDPDLNCVEIDDRDGRHFIEEPVLTQTSSEESGVLAAALAAAKAVFRDR
jgi:hypothetical protein